MSMNQSVEMKSQQVTLLSIFQNSTISSPSPSLSFTGSFSYSSAASSSLLSGSSFTSAQESFTGPSQRNIKNQINHVIDQELVEKYDDDDDDVTFIEQNISDVDYLYNGGSVNHWTEKENGLWGENPFDEIKELISTNNTASSSNNFLFDD